MSTVRCLQVTSTFSRSQAQNVDDCLRKVSRLKLPLDVSLLTPLHHELHALVLDTVVSSIHNEPSDAQRRRVSSLVNAERSRSRVLKAKRKDIKGGRSRAFANDQ